MCLIASLSNADGGLLFDSKSFQKAIVYGKVCSAVCLMISPASSSDLRPSRWIEAIVDDRDHYVRLFVIRLYGTVHGGPGTPCTPATPTQNQINKKQNQKSMEVGMVSYGHCHKATIEPLASLRMGIIDLLS